MMKALFFDIDGTLIHKQCDIFQIPKGVLDELKRIQHLGHKVFIATGRPMQMLNCGFLDKGFDGYVVANGGYIEVDGKSIHEELMDYDVLVGVCDLLEEIDCQYMIQTNKEIYINQNYKDLYDLFIHMGNGINFKFDFDRNEILKETIKLEALSKDKGAIIRKALKERFENKIKYDSNGTLDLFELYSAKLSKAEGIKRVCQYYGIDIKDTYSFGDGMNDMEMIKMCGTGVAMGNAVDALKEAADIVCDHIKDDGLEKILKELF